MTYLIVFLGAGLGGAMRHFASQLLNRWLGTGFPYGIVCINIVGSTVMGLIVGYLASRGAAPQQWRLFLTTGLLGGFTTFSAFSLDVVLLYERGRVAESVAYAAASVGLSILGLVAGLWLVRSLN